MSIISKLELTNFWFHLISSRCILLARYYPSLMKESQNNPMQLLHQHWSLVAASTNFDQQSRFYRWPNFSDPYIFQPLRDGPQGMPWFFHIMMFTRFLMLCKIWYWKFKYYRKLMKNSISKHSQVLKFSKTLFVLIHHWSYILDRSHGYV